MAGDLFLGLEQALGENRKSKVSLQATQPVPASTSVNPMRTWSASRRRLPRNW